MSCFKCNNCKNSINFQDVESKLVVEENDKFYIIEDIEDGRRTPLLCGSCKTNFKMIYWFGSTVCEMYNSSLKLIKRE